MRLSNRVFSTSIHVLQSLSSNEELDVVVLGVGCDPSRCICVLCARPVTLERRSRVEQ